MKTILIVDDDVYIGDMLEELLTKENYDVGRAYSGTEALMYLSSRRPDLILLDLMLPGLSGEELLPLIKGIPVIVVSAKAEVSDKVSLLLGGAADYVTKPFDTSELLARITVQLRKNDVPESSDILSFDTISLNTETRAVTVSDTPVRLTQTEYAILKLLMANPSQVITKSVMLDRISEDTPDCTESSLKVHISNLRKKLKAVNGKDYIEAIWGIGFKLNEEL
ncbi:MAG TPA: response regulator transcription factor [Candidatus Mediterraneibacter ornithocaccae]|nr:response regulator transcription factor [Candidatus Mediterraneibacter ornithocaccae]